MAEIQENKPVKNTATIKDVAKKAQVSPAAVSRILNNDMLLSVKPETREKVFRAAEELGYKKKHTRRKGFCLGIVQWFTAEEEIRDNYYLKIRQGIEDFCAKNIITTVRIFRNDEDYAEKLKDTNGIICIGKFSSDKVNELIDINPNIIFLDMPVKNRNVTTVTLDFASAVKDVIDYFISLKHRRIAFIAGKEYVGSHEPLTDERTTSFFTYMREKGLEPDRYFAEGAFSSTSGYQLMKKMLDEDNIPSAVFCASDNIAFGAIKAIKEAGLRIPDDISVAGFDDTEISAFMTPALTTIHAPAYDMGQHGANLLFVSSNLSIKTPLKVKIPCKLIVRDSCVEAKN
ncbi:MAG: LacI family DNA-binding transcriptional regulator [Lachnospiraceae bacterium]|jgi:LacI family transcriptional regulator|nr:LacI family DNA-binding transcriptional regulator [Lachnospiraceae bacterium]MEE3460634.1 LacI family DNA-binding transcriptional regulator [Lachnospiraceae bacterium]